MGSIIGGLYAAGWSPDEMEEIVRTIDWDNIFTDHVDRKDRSFRRKQDDRPVLIKGRLGFDGLKPVMPSGVISGQRLELALRIIEALSPAESFFNAFFMGGLGRLSGLGNNELFGDKIALAKLVAYRRLLRFEAAGLQVKIYAGLTLEAGNAYFDDENISWGNMLMGGSVFIGGDTFIGPIIFAYGLTEGNRDRFYFAIGDRF